MSLGGYPAKNNIPFILNDNDNNNSNTNHDDDDDDDDDGDNNNYCYKTGDDDDDDNKNSNNFISTAFPCNTLRWAKKKKQTNKRKTHAL